MSKYDWNLNLIIDAVKESINFTEVLEKIGIPRQGNNGKTLRKILDENNIDYSHFTGRARKYAKPNSTKAEDYFGTDKKIQTSKLKEKLLKEGYKENKCEICGITEWLGNSIICQLHHINGDNTDNRLENLQMLCPNCHSQTDNYCGSANQKEKKKYYCADCGVEITRGATYCTSCAAKHHRKVELPLKETLINDFKELQNISAIGRKYEVTDSSIRKWLKKYELPYRTNELKEYIKSL